MKPPKQVWPILAGISYLLLVFTVVVVSNFIVSDWAAVAMISLFGISLGLSTFMMGREDND